MNVQVPTPTTGRGRWMALTAALLGWMFDGLEMGLFPLVQRPALTDLLAASDGSQSIPPNEQQITLWIAVITAGFLVGAATGGVLFGWLGDRIGRVRAMTLSVLTYALFSGACGFAGAAWQIAILRFIASLGMGGEWSLGVALVMEVWPNRSRALLAGMIGAAANFGYMLMAVVGLALGAITQQLQGQLLDFGVSPGTVEYLTGHSAWRLLMLLAATPALLTFFIRIFVPESERWLHEQAKGATSHWANRDLLGVLVGSTAACGLIAVWATEVHLAVLLPALVVLFAVALMGFLYPMKQYLLRSTDDVAERRSTLQAMLLGSFLSGIPLLATWASVQQGSTWADKLREDEIAASKEWQQRPKAEQTRHRTEARAWTQFYSAFGAVLGSMGGALLGGWLGRRLTYVALCILSLVANLVFFLGNDAVNTQFYTTMFLAGLTTASFYGWLPLYLPELFRTKVRATGQGFCFNFGRILASIGVLQPPGLMNALEKDYARACSVMSAIYLAGLVVIWFAPETKGQPLPE